jgi:hypothetical protein
MARDLGDFQTPDELVAAVLRSLGPIGERWPRVLEPTCGSGGFIRGLLESSSPPREILGFELQSEHLDRARRLAADSTRVYVRQANIFQLDLRRDAHWSETGSLLVIGNPPWVTNAELGALGSGNLPRKSNLKGLPGLDAITGSANFDIAEFIWLKLMLELADQQPAIALLCKTSVARNVLQFASDNQLPLTAAWIRRIDAKRHFNAAVDACLFYVEMRDGESRYEAAVYSDLQSSEPETIIGVSGGRLVSDLNAYRQMAFVEGDCPLTWRQGVKHDAAQVMELKKADQGWSNQLGEHVEVEEEFVYPLIKGRELFLSEQPQSDRYVIVPQRRIGEDTRGLELVAPRLWNYLNRHVEIFRRRKSAIYRGQPPFAIFGVGDYSFAPFKVGVSGLHKEPRFRLASPADKHPYSSPSRPTMLDDTCYFLPCFSFEQAALLLALLNHQVTQSFIRSTMFLDAKRPITKKLLQRIDLIKLLQHIDREELLAAADHELARWSGKAALGPPGWPNDLSNLLSGRAGVKQNAGQMNLFAKV